MGNFNEEFEKELSELNLGGQIVTIAEEDKGTPEDYAKLESGILLRVEENRNMLYKSAINAKQGLPVGVRYPNLFQACHKYPEIQLRKKEKAVIIDDSRIGRLKVHKTESVDKNQLNDSILEEQGPVKKLTR